MKGRRKEGEGFRMKGRRRGEISEAGLQPESTCRFHNYISFVCFLFDKTTKPCQLRQTKKPKNMR